MIKRKKRKKKRNNFLKTKLLHCNKRTILLINEKREREKETLGVKNYKER
jgi:hypothetical protein